MNELSNDSNEKIVQTQSNANFFCTTRLISIILGLVYEGDSQNAEVHFGPI